MKEINHLSVHQCLRSAIPESQQPTSPIGFLFLKLPPPPCAVLLVHVPLSMSTPGTPLLFGRIVLQRLPNLRVMKNDQRYLQLRHDLRQGIAHGGDGRRRGSFQLHGKTQGGTNPVRSVHVKNLRVDLVGEQHLASLRKKNKHHGNRPCYAGNATCIVLKRQQLSFHV